MSMLQPQLMLVSLALLSGATVAPGETESSVPRIIVPLPPAVAVEYATGAKKILPMQEVWRPNCSNPEAITVSDLARIARSHRELASSGNVLVIDTPRTELVGLDIVFNVSGSIPAGAPAAIAAAEAYIESQFSDPITVTIDCSFAPMSPGVIGGTGSAYGYVTYAGTRSGLVAGMDGNDTIQSFLPSGSTVPVRYNGNTSSVTNENRVFWTLANYNAAVAFVAGTAASMQFNSNFTFDWDPSNGVSGGTISFQDVVVHETAHALGFTSGGDFRSKDLEVLDLWRFQTTDGSGDYNPDSTAEFQVRPRLVSWNKPNDSHHVDMISVEYRMADGSPWQMSHFREQVPNIGLMDPAIDFGETHYPNFYATSDLTMIDAIGYDR